MKQGIVIVTAVFLFLGCKSRAGEQSKKTEAPIASVEQKVETLKNCGLTLAPPFAVTDLTKSLSPETLNEGGYDTLLSVMGSAEENAPGRNYSPNVWYFDTEAISDTGDYKRIAERMVELSQRSLQLQNIQDHVDIEKGEAWLSFSYKGKPVKINLEVNDDWVDPSLFGRFVDLLNQSDPSKIYLYYDLGGQDCVISCVKKEQFECLKGQGIKFVPLS